MVNLKKDGTPKKKPGRKPNPNRAVKVRVGRKGPRPYVWKCGPDEDKHQMYIPWLRAKAQASFRKEEWLLEFEEYYAMWKDHWHNRGRANENVCMTRYDPDGAWSKDNAYIITRLDHLRQQNALRARPKPPKTLRPRGRPRKTPLYDKLKVEK